MFALRTTATDRRDEIDFVLGDGFLLTVHEPSGTRARRHHLRGDGLAPILTRGADHLLWAIVDALVDGYFPFIDKLGDEIDEIQDAVIEKADARDAGAAVRSSSAS